MSENKDIEKETKEQKDYFEQYKKVGMLPKYGEHLRKMSLMFGTAISFRCPDPRESWQIPARRTYKPYAQKTGMTLSKSINWGPAKGLIPYTDLFSKMYTDEKHFGKTFGIHKNDKKYRTKYFNNGDLKVAHVKETLISILNRSDEKRDYEILQIEKYNHEWCLTFKCNPDKCPKAINEHFFIKLAQGKNIPKLDENTWNLDEIDTTLFNNKFKESKCDLEQDSLLYKEFTVYYKGEQSYTFYDSKEQKENRIINATDKPIPIVANKHGVPFTGDWDLLMVGHPPDIKQKYRQVINTFDIKNYNHNKNTLRNLSDKYFDFLITKFPDIKKELAAKLKANNIIFADLVSEFSLSRAGCITPYEFVQNTMINCLRHGQNAKNKPSFNEIQHGAENRNPYAASNLDGRMIHFDKGTVEITDNIDGLVKFMSGKDYLTRNGIDVNPQWDMEQWSQVIEAQLKIATSLANKNTMDSVYFPPHATLNAYQKHIENKKVECAIYLNQLNRISIICRKSPGNNKLSVYATQIKILRKQFKSRKRRKKAKSKQPINKNKKFTPSFYIAKHKGCKKYDIKVESETSELREQEKNDSSKSNKQTTNRGQGND